MSRDASDGPQGRFLEACGAVYAELEREGPRECRDCDAGDCVRCERELGAAANYYVEK